MAKYKIIYKDFKSQYSLLRIFKCIYTANKYIKKNKLDEFNHYIMKVYE